MEMGDTRNVKNLKCFENICVINDLINVWRVRNPVSKRFTWRQKTPVIQRRLELMLKNSVFQMNTFMAS